MKERSLSDLLELSPEEKKVYLDSSIHHLGQQVAQAEKDLTGEYAPYATAMRRLYDLIIDTYEVKGLGALHTIAVGLLKTLMHMPQEMTDRIVAGLQAMFPEALAVEDDTAPRNPDDPINGMGEDIVRQEEA